MKKELVCILCPRGCALQVEICGEEATVVGNGCPRGARYGKEESLHPKRTVTAVLPVANRRDTAISVKTEAPIPKEKVMALMERLRAKPVLAPVEMGQCIFDDAFGTRVVTTCRVL